MANEDPPYRVEYAKSNRSSCKSCLSLIAKDSLRIAIMVQSRHFDGKEPKWHHYTCFFSKCRPKSVDDVGHFHNLRWEDQEKVRAQIERPGCSGANKENSKSVKLVKKSLPDFVIQYALSNRSACKKCEGKIEKDEIRISHKEFDPEKPQIGLVDRWHHVGCFMKARKELGWDDSEYTAEMLTGFKGLDTEDRNTIKKLLQKKGKKTKKTGAKEAKIDVKTEMENNISQKLRGQSSLLWKVIDNLKKQDLKKPELVQILEENNQTVPKGIDKIYDRIADGMIFGRLPPCSVCGDGQLVASSRGFYQCTGNISGWTSCTNTTLDVKRTPWVIPAELKDEYPYLKKYRFKAKDRVFPPTVAPKPLKNKKILLVGKLSKSKEDIKADIEKLGGSVTTSLSKAYCCISTQGEVDSKKKRIRDAEVEDIFIVSETFLTECAQMQSQTSVLLPLLKKFSLASWGTERACTGDGKSMKRIMEEERIGASSSKKMKVVVKSGAAVDPESNMEDDSEVLVHNGHKHTATLSMVDMKSGHNSFYKLQLLQNVSGRRWHIFRAWGRVGTNIGGTKLEDFRSLNGALDNFHEVYLEKTGNKFGCSDFVKYPKKFYPLEIDYGEDDESKFKLDGAGASSKLAASVQEIVKMIFDLESMKKAMMEFEIDLNKMPLGKLSKRQMQTAYSVLTEATELIKTNELVGGKMLDCSNRFYTLIPHDYGFEQPPLLDNEDIIKAKASMLDNLMDIEVAYNILKGGKEVEGAENEDPLDASYKKLQCEIDPVEKDSEEFNLVKNYVELTHASTHDQYTLAIDELFKVNRKGEDRRFRPFQKLPNRQLLWHGSRATNFAGILSQGLRIAPPEAPVTGYMFGKGIYFADMVSKSANYCGSSHSNPYGLGLLADVALGNMYELTNAKNVRKLPKGKHSVKGIGTTEPDKSTHVTTTDGVTVPMGKESTADLTRHNNQTSKTKQYKLVYNEYIVYDVAQVNLKYLVKFKFNYKSL
ncbi:poly [ADP-ribose] polymerase 1-like isoform X2 [Clavelina lepadiformis]